MKPGDIVVSALDATDVNLYNIDSPDGIGGDDDFESPYVKITANDVLLVVSNSIRKIVSYDDEETPYRVEVQHVKVMRNDGSTGWAEVDWLEVISDCVENDSIR